MPQEHGITHSLRAASFYEVPSVCKAISDVFRDMKGLAEKRGKE